MYIPIYGYTVGGLTLTLEPPRPNACIKVSHLQSRRTITAVLCANYPLLVSMPMASTTDGYSAVAGCIKRCTSAMPLANAGTLVRFERFVAQQISTFAQLERNHHVSVNAWLADTSYSAKLKARMTQEYLEEKHPCDNKKFNEVGQFVKNERFPEFKLPRLINAKRTQFKFHFGPIVSEVEKVVYEMPEFIKKVPVSQRPKYIIDKICGDGRRYFTTDFTSFEANFTPYIMRVCENALIRHMFSCHHLFPKVDWMCRAIEGSQVCRSKLGYTMMVEGTRMSGEMSTSLSNGFSNLMFMRFVFATLGVTDLRIVVEGDDAIMSIPGDSPTPTVAHFAELGLKVKLEEHHSICTASFCGLVFAPEDLINVTDPIAAVVEMCVISDKCANMRPSKKLSFLKAKAMSAKYQYNGCPIVDAFASWILRETSRYDVRVATARCSDWWTIQKQIMMTADTSSWKVRTPTPPATRRLVEDVYSISIADQTAIEVFFDGCGALTPWFHPTFHSLCPADWAKAWDIQTQQADDLTTVRHPYDLPLPPGKLKAAHKASPPRWLRHFFEPRLDGWDLCPLPVP